MRNKRIQKITKRLLVGALLLFAALAAEFAIHRYMANRGVAFRTQGSAVQIRREKKWRDFDVNGVNLSEAEFGENAAKDEYRRWFKELAAAGVNVIRVNSILSPDFYKAFFAYNALTAAPIYLLHGVSIEEGRLKAAPNAYDAKLNDDFFEEIRRTIDVVHGKAAFTRSDGHSEGAYNLKIAPYVIGYAFGGELDAEFVANTNEKNQQITGFEGDYFYTANATPYESWLAAVGNYAVSYEQDTHGGPARLVSWTNWSGGPEEELKAGDREIEEALGINFDHIRITEKFNAGILAAFHFLEKVIGRGGDQ